MWIGFSDSIENQIEPDGALASVRGLANKLPEHAARLAAVLTLVADAEAIKVSSDHMAAGITLAQHYVAEALRMFEGSQDQCRPAPHTETIGLVKRLLE